jgi:hypothetical protein
MIAELWIGKDIERKSRGQIRGNIWDFPWGAEENHENPYEKSVSRQRFEPGNLMNTSQKHYHLSQLA